MPSSKTGKPGISLVVQWLRLCAFNAEGTGSVPGQGTRSHVLTSFRNVAILCVCQAGVGMRGAHLAQRVH